MGSHRSLSDAGHQMIKSGERDCLQIFITPKCEGQLGAVTVETVQFRWAMETEQNRKILLEKNGSLTVK